MDDLAAEAIRAHLVLHGWRRGDIFLDFSLEGIGAHEKWKASLAHANSRANALLCLVSREWLTSRESQVERRVAESLSELDARRSRAIVLAILRDVTIDDLRTRGFGEYEIVDLSASGRSILIRAELPGRDGEPGQADDVKFNLQALEKIERSLRMIGIAPDSFEWNPRDHARSSPYPGLEAFTEDDAGVFFGREARLAEALRIIDELRRSESSRLLSIIGPSGIGKSSFLRAGLWPRLARQSGVAPLAVLRPGAGILSSRQGGLFYALSEWFRHAGQSLAPGDIRQWFVGCSTREGLAECLRQAARVTPERETLILGIDQAEELFDTTDAAQVDEAERFLEALLSLLGERIGGIDLLVILAIRADSYEPLATKLASAPERADAAIGAERSALNETSLTLQPLAATAYRDVIRRPAQVALRTDRDVFELSLVDYLVETFTGANALPLLAMTLDQLFAEYKSRTQITLEDYTSLYLGESGAIGPVRRALAEAYRLAGPAGTDETLRRLLIPALATWDPQAGEGGAAKRRIASRSSLLGHDAERTRLADALVSSKVRLLTSGFDESGPTLEISHEALLHVPPVKGWVEELAGALRLRDELDREAAEWVNAQHSLTSANARSGRPDGAENLAALQTAIDAAIAARRGPRLEAANILMEDPIFAGQIHSHVRSYIDACNAKESEERERQRSVELEKVRLTQQIAQRTAEGRVARDREKIRALLGTQKFTEASKEVDDLVCFLKSNDDAKIQELAGEFEERSQRIHRLETFFTAARLVWRLSGEEDFDGALLMCRRALEAIEALTDEDWWKKLPIETLSLNGGKEVDDGAQLELLQQESYQQLLLYSALQIVPGIQLLSPPPQKARRFDIVKLAGFLPRRLLLAVIVSGRLQLLRRRDNAQASSAFKECLKALSQVEHVERSRAEEKGKPYQPSRTSRMIRQIATVLADYASGPRGSSVNIRELFAASKSFQPRPEPVNDADYFFVALFNYFIAKRQNLFVAKIIALLQKSFPDLDDRNPYLRAERLLRSAIGLKLNNYWPHWLLGRTLQGRGDMLSAELAFNGAIAIEARYARGYEQRALSIAGQWANKPDESLRTRAFEDSNRAMSVADGDPSIFWPRGEMFEALGQIAEALDSYTLWLELEENVFRTISRSSGVTRLHQLAREILNDENRNGLHAAAHALLARVYLIAPQFSLAPVQTVHPLDLALQEAEMSLNLDAGNFHAMIVKGAILKSRGQNELAIRLFTDAINGDAPKQNYLAALHRCQAYEAANFSSTMGEWQAFIEWAKKGIMPQCPHWIIREAQAALARFTTGNE